MIARTDASPSAASSACPISPSMAWFSALARSGRLSVIRATPSSDFVDDGRERHVAPPWLGDLQYQQSADRRRPPGIQDESALCSPPPASKHAASTRTRGRAARHELATLTCSALPRTRHAALTHSARRVGVSFCAAITPTRNAIGLSRPTVLAVMVADGRLSPWRSVLPPHSCLGLASAQGEGRHHPRVNPGSPRSGRSRRAARHRTCPCASSRSCRAPAARDRRDSAGPRRKALVPPRMPRPALP